VVVRAANPGTQPVMMSMRINGVVYAAQQVSVGSYRNYTFTVTLRGDDILNVVAEDASGSKKLSVESIQVAGVTVPVAGTTIFDAGAGNDAFDGQNVSQGSTDPIVTPGALRFVRGGSAYAAGYDKNGNMTSRLLQDKAYLMQWDAENRLTQIKQGSSVSTFQYDGDGRRVKATIGVTTTLYIGDYYEVTSGVATQYYYLAGKRVAMRNPSGVQYLLSDHPSAGSGQAWARPTSRTR